MSATLNQRVEDIIDTFQSVDGRTRLELLLDYAKKIPPLPAHLHETRDKEEHQVHECMTPVFLWVERENGAMRFHADVAEEAPTVRGYVSLLLHAIDGASAQEIQDLPNDLLERLRLHEVIRMNRVVGLSAILSRIKREAAGAASLTE